jgi:hypothetical protein
MHACLPATQVPTAVAQVWRPLCEAAMRSTSIDEDEDGAVELGTVKSVPSQVRACRQAYIVLAMQKASVVTVAHAHHHNRMILRSRRW